MPAGSLHNRVAFDSRVTALDDYGNVLGDWSSQFTVWARKLHLRGSETVMASRLDGRQPVVITVRRTPQTETIATSWRARDVNSGDVYNIRSITPTDDRAWIDLLCEAGVPSG